MQTNKNSLAPILFVLIAGCGVVTSDKSETTASTSEAVRNGDAVDPWAAGSVASPAQAIVNVDGCTGTLVDPSWVLSATHCGYKGFTSQRVQAWPQSFTCPGPSCLAAVAAVISVFPLFAGTSAVLKSTVYTERRYIDRVVRHPTLDVVMLHLDGPFFVQAPAVSLYSGTTASLAGKSMTCYGYGAISAEKTSSNQSCQADTDCLSGSSCRGGSCLTWGALYELFDAVLVATPNPAFGQFDLLANSRQQLLLPGDSGGPCFYQSEANDENGIRVAQLAGVTSWWSFDLSTNGEVSVADAAPVINATLNSARNNEASFNVLSGDSLIESKPYYYMYEVLSAGWSAATAMVQVGTTTYIVMSQSLYTVVVSGAIVATQYLGGNFGGVVSLTTDGTNLYGTAGGSLYKINPVAKTLVQLGNENWPDGTSIAWEPGDGVHPPALYALRKDPHLGSNGSSAYWVSPKGASTILPTPVRSPHWNPGSSTMVAIGTNLYIINSYDPANTEIDKFDLLADTVTKLPYGVIPAAPTAVAAFGNFVYSVAGDGIYTTDITNGLTTLFASGWTGARALTIQ